MAVRRRKKKDFLIFIRRVIIGLTTNLAKDCNFAQHLLVKKMNKRTFITAALALLLTGCSGGWTSEEKRTIGSEGELLRVLTVDNPEDEEVLRQQCTDLQPGMIDSELYRTLAEKMVATVTSPEQDGVGIAGPQVGILRRIVAVLRYDREGEPFEVYPNIRITDFHGEKEYGPEGCLSVPGKRGDVARYQEITISYTDPVTLRDTSERISGFTAVIFQHECDHLDGILYTDRMSSR